MFENSTIFLCDLKNYSKAHYSVTSKNIARILQVLFDYQLWDYHLLIHEINLS